MKIDIAIKLLHFYRISPWIFSRKWNQMREREKKYYNHGFSFLLLMLVFVLEYVSFETTKTKRIAFDKCVSESGTTWNPTEKFQSFHPFKLNLAQLPLRILRNKLIFRQKSINNIFLIAQLNGFFAGSTTIFDIIVICAQSCSHHRLTISITIFTFWKLYKIEN